LIAAPKDVDGPDLVLEARDLVEERLDIGIHRHDRFVEGLRQRCVELRGSIFGQPHGRRDLLHDIAREMELLAVLENGRGYGRSESCCSESAT
jgi:hypothetical protein